jgi:hypothetical protein
MLETMARRGFEKPAWFTPLEFACHLPVGENERITEFTALYNASRFGGDASGIAKMAEMLQETGRVKAGGV